MKKKYQNGFFIFGLAVLVIMITQLDVNQVLTGLRRAGYWFPAVIALWFFLYIFNASAWYIIINSSNENNDKDSASKDNMAANDTDTAHKDNGKVPFWWLYKITVSGFALNYATPGGLMGGEPYRIMSLSPIIGTKRASSSVILYAMTHIFSHFWFWLLSIILYVLTQRVNMFMGIMLSAVGAFCLLAIWFFIKGYKKGITVRCMNILRHFPMIRHKMQGIFERHKEQLSAIDMQIAALHNQNRRTFVSAVLLELACRVASALEIYFILLVIIPDASYINSILTLAFTSLFANMLFFMPLQLGGREGGFLMSANGLAMTANAGIFVALLVRIRELIWTAIGLLLIKFDKK
ncbi:MAG: flippase-like domain-containing protein [Prevotella sp.]|nr:flippase-like domain-containing protein [Prevotella sp.]